MASGNIGSLFMTLGLKDEISIGLDKVAKKLSGAQKYTDELRGEIANLRKELKSVSGTDISDPFRKSLEFIKKYDESLYNTITRTNRLAYALRGITQNKDGKININLSNIPVAIRELAKLNQELNKIDDKDDKRAFKTSISNATDYLKLLQTIERKKAELNEIALSSRNIDKGVIASARSAINSIQSEISRQLFNIQNGSIVHTDLMPNIKKLLSMSITEMGDYMRNLKKDNPLSVFVNSADMLTSKIAAANKKILEMQALMRGSKVPGLFDTSALNGLRGVVGKMQSLINKEGKGEKTDISKINRLVSEYAKLTSQAELATSTFRRMSREYDNASARLVSWYSKYRELQSIRDKRVSLYLDTKDVDAELARIRAMFNELNTIRNGLKAGNEGFIGMLGSRGTGVDAGIYNNVKKAANEEIAAREKIAKQAERFVENEIKTEQRRNEQRLKDLDHEAIALQRNAEIQQKLQAQQERSQKRQDIEALKEEYRLKDAKLKQLDREGKALQRNAEIQQRLQDQKERSRKKADKEAADAEKQRQRELEVSQRRVQSLEKAYVRLKEATLVSKSYGLNTRDAETQIARLSAEIDTLKGKISILQTAGFKSVLGTEMYTGTGKSVTEANRIASQYERANKEAEKNAAIEEKRKLKIAESGRQIQSSLVRGFKDANNAAGRLNSTIQDLKSLFLQGGLVFGAQQFAMSIIRTGGEMEKQHIAMQSILGDMQNANTMFNQTKELALQSPFTFSELNRDVKQLAAYGVEYENLYDTTKRLADMASGLGVSFERIALAFGQVQARGWLDGKELRQIAYAGIPLLDRLSKYYSMREGKKVTTSDVKGRITNREVSFQDVKNIFWEMTDAGGQFYNMQLTLSETLLGRYNKLKDAWEIMLADFARGDSVIGGTFKWVLDIVTSLVQQMHTLGPVMAAAFTGFAIKKGITSLGSGGAASFLSNKANLADNVQAKLMQGQKLSQIEQQILLTKNRITNADLRSLIAYQNINKNELRRLYISGAITKEQYKISLALMKHVGLTNAAAASTNKYALSWRKVGVAGMLALNGIGNAAKGLWAAIGGLPGLILTALTMGVTTLVSRYQDLTQKIKQTQDEIFDRRKQVADFTSQNNVAKAISSGEQKEIDNLIESYKEKLKELAPYDYSNLIMRAEEKKSHEERLKFLEQELKLIDEANKMNSGRFADNGTWYEDLLGITGKGRDSYSGFMSVIKSIDKSASSYLLSQAKANAFGATSADQAIFDLNKNGFQNYALKVKEFISKEFGDISKDENLRRQAVQAMNSIFSALGVSAENANLIRASVLQAFGIYNDGWLSEEVGKRMSDLISERFPEIALKIKSDQSLNEGEKKKVAQLMNDAKNELINQYPVFSTTLQNLLDKSNFTAVISLVTQEWGGSFNDMQKEIAGRVPQNLDKEMLQYYSGLVDSWGKEGDWYSARNKAQSDISLARNQYKSAVDGKSEKAGKYKKKYEDLMLAAEILLNYDYEGELKKSNKEPKGSKEDSELKALRERIDAFKAFRQMYQKAKEVMPKDKAKDWAYGLFPEMKDLNPDDYIGSIDKLKKGFNFKLSDERKKALTSLNREIGDWKISELLKPEFEKAAANFKEALDKTMKQWDLWRTLMDKTGKEDFANLAFTNGGIFDEQANNLIRQFEADYGMKFPGIYTNDGDAKKDLEGIAGAYERWKAIADLVKNNYVKYLQEAADIIEKTATTEEKILAINEKYDRLAKIAESQGNTKVATRYRIQQRKEVASTRLEGFERSSEYTNFFGSILSLTAEQAKTAAEKIRVATNEAFQQGAIDAREYAKRIKQINEQMEKLQQPRKSFLNGGMQGIAQQRYDDGESLLNKASNEYEKWQEKYNEAEIANNEEAMNVAKEHMKAAEKNKVAGKNMMSGASDMMTTIAIIDAIVQGINNTIQGLNEAFGYVKEAADAMGVDTESDGWQDANAWFSAASSMSSGATKAWEGLKNGNVGGIISGVAQSITGPITAFAKANDAKLDRRIQQAERNIRAIDNMSNNISTLLEKILGGLYSYTNNADTVKALKDMMQNNEKGSEAYNAAQKALNSGNYFDTQYAALLAQKSEIQKQRDAEDRKKKTDQDALADYDQQLKELDMQIKSYAQDFLKEMYNIDLKSWASQLTDSIVEAWSKGEDAATAYHDKVQELIKDLTKNILSQKIMEMALQPTLDKLKGILQQKGKLDETDIPGIADDLIEAGNNTVENITNILDALKEQGWDLSENGTLSVSNSIKSITEDTADILASYLNSIRLDCSVNRENLRLILIAVQSVPEMNNIARSQLTQLTTLVTLAEARNSKLDDMYSWMNKVTNGVLKISMK